MKNILEKVKLFSVILICILLSVILTSIYSYSVKKDLMHEIVGVKLIVDTQSEFEANLFYTYGQSFHASHKLNNKSSALDTLLFKFPKSKEIIKKFRIDFGNNRNISPVKIKQLQLLFKQQKICLNQKEVFNSLYNISPSVELDKKNRIIHFNKSNDPFDPYIIFSPLGELLLNEWKYSITLLIPFLVLLPLFFYKKKLNITIPKLLLLLFIICIPLKIAWTTFCAILLCLYSLSFALYKKKIFYENRYSYIYFGIFCLIILFGRPSNFSVIDMLWPLLLFAFMGLTFPISKIDIYKYYVHFFLFLNAVMVASGISFLIWFSDFYGLNISDYFGEIKGFSSNIRSWVIYDHAAFLSFFGLIGVLFLNDIYDLKQINKRLFYLYHILLFIFIVLSGVRICLLIYFVYIFNIMIKQIHYKQRLFYNILGYAVFASILIFNIKKIDVNRYTLWTVSWEAIKEKPFFGYGLGQSDIILHSKYFNNNAGVTVPLEFNHSHNQIITFLLEIGLVGTLALIILLSWFLYKGKYYKDDTLVLFVLGLSYMFLTESVFETSKPMYVICFLFLVIMIQVPYKMKKVI